MERDLFISYASKDAAAAAAICRALEAKGLLCWIAPRDIIPGTDYPASLAHAIPSCCVLLLLLSRHANESPWVHREVERAVSRGKAVLTVRLENVAPNEKLELFVSSSQWIDVCGQKPSLYLPALSDKVRLLLAASGDRLPRPSAAGEGTARRDEVARATPDRESAPGTGKGAAAPAPTPPAKTFRPAVFKPLVAWLAAGGLLALALSAAVLMTKDFNLGNDAARSSDTNVSPANPGLASATAHFRQLGAQFEDTMLDYSCNPDAWEHQSLVACVDTAPAADRGWMVEELNRLEEECRAVNGHGSQGRAIVTELKARRAANGL